MMKLTSTDKHKNLYLEYADEIITSYLFLIC
jgi:small nuclear ribonucleoprotein (snRNP)-like protein